MMEHTTDRLFWTLIVIIIGALILTIGINAFPKAMQGVIQPISGVIKQADTTTNTASEAANNIINQDVPDASTLGYSITNNGDGTGTINNYTGNQSAINIPSQLKVDAKILKITTIGNTAFANKSISSVTIPDSISTIGYGAFQNDGLTSVSVSKNTSTIHNWAFYGNELTHVTVSNIVEIDAHTFDNFVNISRY